MWVFYQHYKNIYYQSDYHSIMKGEELKRIRKQLDFTQQQLADKIGVTINAVQNWEYGKRKINKTVEAFVKNLQLDQQKKDRISDQFSELNDATEKYMTVDMIIQEKVDGAVKKEFDEFKKEYDGKLLLMNQNIITLLRRNIANDDQQKKDTTIKKVD